MSINTKDLIEAVIRPALQGLGMNGIAAEQLIAGTIAHESLMGTYLRQQGGPAKGICQMEPATHDDIYNSFLKYKRMIADRLYVISNLAVPIGFVVPSAELLTFNLKYAVGMCRIQYYRQPEVLPPADNVEAMASYWKRYYNTPLGKGVINDFIANYNKFVAPYYT
jgi:hypothetical protein